MFRLNVTGAQQSNALRLFVFPAHYDVYYSLFPLNNCNLTCYKLTKVQIETGIQMITGLHKIRIY